jgi:hypothetical protein
VPENSGKFPKPAKKFLNANQERQNSMMTITKIKKTCWACPSQWEGKTKDGRAVYIRFRWGNLSVCAGKSVRDAIRNNKIISVS